MKKLLTYLVWPALAGFSFAVVLLLAPWLTAHIPALAPFVKNPEPVAAPAPLASTGISYSPAIKKAAPAVVSINSSNIVERTATRLSYFLRAYVRETRNDQINSLGSGVIISKDGYIVTSYHVFFGDDPNTRTNDAKITVTLNDGRELQGMLVALDEKNDLALIRIEQNNLPFLALSDSQKLEVGDVVLAIGNPRNIGQSVSSGIISALWRKDDSFIIQTDAAINPGNSGGALIDVNGDLIGINSTIISESGGSEGISLAIAAGKAMELLNEYLSTPPGGYLGVSTTTLSKDSAPALRGKNIQGFLINKVTPNGPAAKAGILADDIITGVNEQKMKITNPVDHEEANRAIAMISGFPAGKLIVLEIYRKGEFLKIPVILGQGRPNFSGVEPVDDSVSTSSSTVVAQPIKK